MAHKSIVGVLQYQKSESLSLEMEHSFSTGKDGSSREVSDLHTSLCAILSPIEEHANSSSPTVVPPNTPTMTPSHSTPGFPPTDLSVDSPFISKDSFATAATSSFNLSLTSDSTEEDGEFSISTSFDGLFTVPPTKPLRMTSPKSMGLGISGVPKNDESGDFDGLGLVGIHPWNRSSQRNSARDSFSNPLLSGELCTTEVNFTLSASDSTGELSHIFLQEALLMYTEDPFHETMSDAIPECSSWNDFDHVPQVALNDALPSLRPAALSQSGKQDSRSKGHFSSATISSELKRSATSAHSFGRNLSRARSATWPTGSAIPVGILDNSPRTASAVKANRGWRF